LAIQHAAGSNNSCENPNIEIRNNIKIQMFEIQNKSGQLLAYSVLVIDISVIRICFEFAAHALKRVRYSNFGFQ